MSDPIPDQTSRADGDTTSIPQMDAVRLDARAASILRRRLRRLSGRVAALERRMAAAERAAAEAPCSAPTSVADAIRIIVGGTG